MRMKSVLALSALSAATFLAGVAYAADAQTTKQTVQTTKQTVQTVTKTQTVPSAKAATPAQTAKPTEAVTSVTDKTVTTETAVKTEHKKHHARHKHHRKHHRHHRHHEHYVHERFYAEVPTWNFLLGGSLGYVAQKEDFITRYTRPAPNSVPAGVAPGPVPLFANNVILPIYVDQSAKITDQGVLFGLLAGWQWHYKRWMVGAEANVDFDSFEKNRQLAWTEGTTNVPIYGTVLYDRGDIYAITGRAGYFVTPFFMPYLRLGAQLSRDEVSYQSLTGSVVTAGAPAPVGATVGTQINFFPDYSSKTKDVYGIVAGIGAEFPTYIGSSTIRFEYNFVKTESVIIEDNIFPVIGNHKFRYPESHIGKIAWVWNFM